MPSDKFVTITHPDGREARVHPRSAEKIWVPQGWSVQDAPSEGATQAPDQASGDPSEGAATT